MARGSPRRPTGPLPSPGRQDPDPRSAISTRMWPWASNLPVRTSVPLSQTEFGKRISQVATRFGGLLSACPVLGTMPREVRVVRGVRWVSCAALTCPRYCGSLLTFLPHSSQNQLKLPELPLPLRRVFRAEYLHPPHHPPAS